MYKIYNKFIQKITRKPNQQIINLRYVGVFILVLLTFTIVVYDIFKTRTATKSVDEINNIEITTFDYPKPYDFKQMEAEATADGSPDTFKVCEYVDVIQTYIENPGPTDEIQKIIGYQNNKVGLYIYAEVSDYMDFAEELANSNGGQWGYVLLPYNVKDYNSSKWGRVFDSLKEKKLIPIIQLWDLDLSSEKERNEQIVKSAEFLNSLQWPIKYRYISAYNEMNDAKFWKGNVNPEEYAEILDLTIKELKDLNPNFFIMNGAFNASARTGGDYLDAETFIKRMDQHIPGIFYKLDGWASHPYPQPNFSGSPDGHGRDSIRAYEWELALLEKYFGIKNIPVFITETGWARKESEATNKGLKVPFRLNQYQVADNIRSAFENVWMKDDRIVAITPFTIRYKPPHDHFSWITQNGNPYPQFYAIKDIKKVEGKPPVVTYHKSKVLECKDNSEE